MEIAARIFILPVKDQFLNEVISVFDKDNNFFNFVLVLDNVLSKAHTDFRIVLGDCQEQDLDVIVAFGWDMKALNRFER